MPKIIARIIVTFVIVLASIGLACASGNFPPNWKMQGQREFESGHYQKAYQLWFAEAEEGDPETQQKVSILLFQHQIDVGKYSAKRKDLALQFLIRSALNGQISAMHSLSAASVAGNFGLRKNREAADCWLKAAHTGQTNAGCAGELDLRHKASRPRCAQISMMDNRDASSEAHGVEIARKCIAVKTLAILVPGPPPGPDDKIKDREYGRYGIERIVTGDSFDEKFEAFRRGFNETMGNEINGRFGADSFSRIDAAIHVKIGGR